jgi:hypothetical protein
VNLRKSIRRPVMTRSKPLALGVVLLGSACFGIALSGCGSSAATKHNAPATVEDQVAAEVHKASACTKVVRSFSALAKNLGVSGSSVATISSTKESLHELAETSTDAQKYTITRLIQVLSKLETVTTKALEDNYSGAHRELPILGAESKELIEKVLTICGKKEVPKSTGGESQSTAAATPTPTAEASAPPNCREAAVAAASTCELEGTTVLVAHGHNELKLRTLAARIEGIRTASSFSSGVGTTTAHGIFLVISLHLTNMASAPQVFDGIDAKQVALSVSKHYYGESFAAENESDKQSFITNEEPIQPGESKTGDLVFDVPPSVVHEVRTLPESGLFIGNFGDNEIEGTPSGTGLITTKGA